MLFVQLISEARIDSMLTGFFVGIGSTAGAMIWAMFFMKILDKKVKKILEKFQRNSRIKISNKIVRKSRQKMR